VLKRVKRLLYRGLVAAVAVFFNTLNVIMGGNLPPFGCVCVITQDEEQDKYLVLERPEGGYVFPGGYMRWRENPIQTVQREGKEETGLKLEIVGLIGCSSTASDLVRQMSTVAIVYEARAVGGELKNSIEGQACWHNEAELMENLQQQQKNMFVHFLEYRSERRKLKRFTISG
jgi:ADP-ribose pyrophosphatase YjhB (NUDIX family)